MTNVKYIFGGVFLLVITYFVGPNPETPFYRIDYPKVNASLILLEDSINKAESSNTAIKLNNQAQIVWANSNKIKTAWSIVYLHGFTASQMEGDPVHKDIAAKYGMNLYLARLSDHGLESDSALLHLTPDRLWETSKLALAIGEVIGNKVILMSTSTGGTLALKLAATYPRKVAAIINYSPNVAINNPLAFFLNKHWGLSLLNAVSDNGYVVNKKHIDSLVAQYWIEKYKTEALPQLQELVETCMVESVFNNVKCPSLTLAYYKDDNHQDPTVKVSAMHWMNASLGTNSTLKRLVEMSTVGVHPMASSLRSKDVEAVELQTSKFLEEVIHINN